MAIIYSYPIEATPTTSDLLLGTSVGDDNKPTKTFNIHINNQFRIYTTDLPCFI